MSKRVANPEKLDELDSKIGAVPSGQTVEGQISSLNSDMATLSTDINTRLKHVWGYSDSSKSLATKVKEVFGTSDNAVGIYAYTCVGAKWTDMPSSAGSYGTGYVHRGGPYAYGLYIDSSGNTFSMFGGASDSNYSTWTKLN